MALAKTKDSKPLADVEHHPTSYVLSFQKERLYRRIRYYWTICETQRPDELVSWGYASTQEQAETLAKGEVVNLSSGLTKGGRVTCKGFSLPIDGHRADFH